MKRFFLFIFLFILLIQFACDLDHGLSPQPGKLQVEVTFKGDPPKDTQGVYLIVAPQFPPHAINELFQSPNSLPTNQDTVMTEIDLPYGEYEACGLWWYSKDTRSNLADILDMPFDLMTGRPIGFTLSPEQPVVQRTLRVYWDYMLRDATIKGTVHFTGNFPENTDVVAIAAYMPRPRTTVHYLVYLKAIDITVETGVKEHHFTLPVPSGSIEYIAVFWLPEKSPLYEIQIISEYMDPDDPEKPGRLLLDPEETEEDIDIFVDWDHIDPIYPAEVGQ